MSQRYFLIPYLLLLTVVGGVAGLRIGEWYVTQSWIRENLPSPMLEFSQYAFMLLGTLVGLLSSSLSFSRFQRMFSGVEKAPFSDKIAGALGLLFGAAVGAAFVAPLGRVPVSLKCAVLVLSSLLGVSFGLSMKDEIANWFGPKSKRGKPGEEPEADAKTKPGVPAKLLDTNVIIDGRIADVCTTGFVEGDMLVPQFVLQELQNIADSEDALRRARGRRGLVMLARMQKDLGTRVQVLEDYHITFEEHEPVDVRLVRVGKDMGAQILTNDFNLNKVAELHGVQVLNVNELANSLKPVFLPGESLTVEIVRAGKTPGQGVGYLDDGTMVVVDGGERRIGEEVSCLVTSVLQTVAGKMIFAELGTDGRHRFERSEASDSGRGPRPGTRGRSGR